MELRLVVDDDPEPSPILVAAQDVTAADLVLAAARCGWLSDPDDRWFTPAVSFLRP